MFRTSLPLNSSPARNISPCRNRPTSSSRKLCHVVPERTWYASGQDKARTLLKNEAKTKRKNWDSEMFVWKKKLEADGDLHLTEVERRKMQKRRIANNFEELEAIKKRRDQRERDREIRREERDLADRDKERQFYEAWHGKEDEFFLNQVKLRSKIRRQQGRSKPIDQLAMYVETVTSKTPKIGEEDRKWLDNPLEVIAKGSLSKMDLEDLIQDIDVYKKVDGGVNDVVWNAVQTVAEFSVRHFSSQPIGGRCRVLDPAIERDISHILTGKTEQQLSTLEYQVREKLALRGTDVSYWETLLLYLRNAKAENLINALHHDLIAKYICSDDIKTSVKPNLSDVALDPLQTRHSVAMTSPSPESSPVSDHITDDLEPGVDGESRTYTVPYLEERSVLRSGFKVVDAEEDKAKLLAARQQVLKVVGENQSKASPTVDLPPETLTSLLGCDVNRYLEDLGFHEDPVPDLETSVL